MIHKVKNTSDAQGDGAGRNRTAAVTLITDAAIKLLNAHGNVTFMGEHSMHFAANIAGVAIEIHPTEEVAPRARGEMM